jgi:hypothetical protein
MFLFFMGRGRNQRYEVLLPPLVPQPALNVRQSKC